MDTASESKASDANTKDAQDGAASSGTSSSKKWYIVHTYSGQETRAKKALLERAKTMGFEEQFDEVLVPEESVVEMVGGKKRTSKRKFFPGYIMVHMDLSDETWHVVKGTPMIRSGQYGGWSEVDFNILDAQSFQNKLYTLDEVNNSILALTLITVGIQTVFSSFMLSILGIKEK